MAFHRLVAAVALAGLLALALPVAAQEPTAAPDVQPSVDDFNLGVYHGDGYSLMIPANATVKEQNPDLTLIFGPMIDIRPADSGRRIASWSYALSITTQDNPQRLSAEAFAQQVVDQLWQRLLTSDGPGGGLPVDSDGHLREDRIARVTLGGEPAFVVVYFGIEGDEYRLYVARGDQMIVFTYQDDTFNRHPLAQVQLDVYALMLATLRFDR